MAQPAAVDGRGSTRVSSWAARIAGGLLVVVGAVNAVLGVLGLASSLVRLGPAVAGGLVGVGTLTVVGGWFVWRGNRRVTLGALAFFGWLFVVQLGDVVTHTGPGPALGGVIGRFAVLALLLAALGVAAMQQRRAPRRRPD